MSPLASTSTSCTFMGIAKRRALWMDHLHKGIAFLKLLLLSVGMLGFISWWGLDFGPYLLTPSARGLCAPCKLHNAIWQPIQSIISGPIWMTCLMKKIFFLLQSSLGLLKSNISFMALLITYFLHEDTSPQNVLFAEPIPIIKFNSWLFWVFIRLDLSYLIRMEKYDLDLFSS